MTTFSKADILRHLETGLINMEGYVPWGSNYTFVSTVQCGDTEMQAVYKPRRGERPLWDFPTGTLCLRERAAYLVSEFLAWEIVPVTILRDGPHGLGSVQLFIEHDPNENYFTFKDDVLDQLRLVSLFDLLINNADRKGGHVILDPSGRVWAIDHGIAFHEEPKLRTVIWDFAGDSLDEAEKQGLSRLIDALQTPSDLGLEMESLLSRRERSALVLRAQNILRQGRFPPPGPGRPYPWPLV